MRNLVWFREDLRIQDNPALFHASQEGNATVIALFLVDVNLWQHHGMATCRMALLLRGVQVLKEALAALNIPLLVRQVDVARPVPVLIASVAEEIQAEAVYFNKQYEIDELRRDALVEQQLKAKQIHCFSYDDQTILPPGSVRTQQGDYFKVFTAFRRAWLHHYQQAPGKLYPAPNAQAPCAIASDPVPASLPNHVSGMDTALWPAGEAAAMQRLQHFIESKLENYHETRDFPALDGTSRLSPYLSTGMISARRCFMAAWNANHQELDSGQRGALTWMSELIWRDFYKHILFAVPGLAMGRAYKPETEQLRWKSNESQVYAWQQGQTGFPLIDAGMRQLNQTGWMHNRLRMVTAMFFTKNLFFDWRLGEQYFINHLIDGDLAANNGGWQWCASTGTDAAPYFRVFNPVTQSERFDPAGSFIRQYCPELASLDEWAIHAPGSRAPAWTKQSGYPMPIVDLSLSRRQAIEAFKGLK